MLFDVDAALAEILKSDQPSASRANPAIPAPFWTPISGNSRNSTPSPVKPQTVPDEELPFAPPPSRHEPDSFSHGFSGDDYRRTWTGKVVSLADWRQMTEWDKHGSTGKLWNGLTRAWEPDGGAA